MKNHPAAQQPTPPVAQQVEAPKGDAWPEYVAGIIETYLGFNKPAGDARDRFEALQQSIDAAFRAAAALTSQEPQ